jgi:hypothetical protein
MQRDQTTFSKRVLIVISTHAVENLPNSRDELTPIYTRYNRCSAKTCIYNEQIWNRTYLAIPKYILKFLPINYEIRTAMFLRSFGTYLVLGSGWSEVRKALERWCHRMAFGSPATRQTVELRPEIMSRR